MAPRWIFLYPLYSLMSYSLTLLFFFYCEKIWQLEETPVSHIKFADIDLTFPPHTMKFTFHINSWPFDNIKNLLGIEMNTAGPPSSSPSSCSNKDLKPDAQSVRWISLSYQGTSLYPFLCTWHFWCYLSPLFELWLYKIWAILQSSCAGWASQKYYICLHEQCQHHCSGSSLLGLCWYEVLLFSSHLPNSNVLPSSLPPYDIIQLLYHPIITCYIVPKFVPCHLICPPPLSSPFLPSPPLPSPPLSPSHTCT